MRRLTLPELRADRGLTTQKAVAEALGVRQPAVAKREQRRDPHLSTLVEMVTALGGDLRLVVDIGEESYELDVAAVGPRERRRMRVVWQHPETRRFIDIGRLLDDGREYRFSYIDIPDGSGFEPFDAFPHPDQEYTSSKLWPFFADRSAQFAAPEPSAERLLGDKSGPLPLVELAPDDASHTGVIQLLPLFDADSDGTVELPFLASGVRYAIKDAPDRVEAALGGLQPGDPLELHRDFDYERSMSHARRLLAGGVHVGYLPDYTVEEIDQLERENRRLEVVADRVAPPGGNPHLRLLCRLQAMPAH